MLAFDSYKKKAWGSDDVMAISGDARNKRNGWGAFIAESSTTFAVMELWDDLKLSVDHLLAVDFRKVDGGLIDPAEATETYLGAYLSLVNMVDEGVVPKSVIDDERRSELLKQASALSEILAPTYNSPSGLPWQLINAKTSEGVEGGLVSPGRVSTGVQEALVSTLYPAIKSFIGPISKAWASLKSDKGTHAIRGLIPGAWAVDDGSPVGAGLRWDSHYETLLNTVILDPKDTKMNAGDSSRKHLWPWSQAARAVRWHLASRSMETKKAPMQHLFMGSYHGSWYKNEMELSDCSAAGNIILGAVYAGRKNLIPLGQALLEGCEYLWKATPSELPPRSIAWKPSQNYRFNTSFSPESDRQKQEFNDHGFWVTEAGFNVVDAVGFTQSLFYAYRITGEQRYRDFAWQVYKSLKRLWTKKGYAGIEDVMASSSEESALAESDAKGVARVLMYLWLIFKDGERGSLDKWVYSSVGHPYRNGH